MELKLLPASVIEDVMHCLKVQNEVLEQVVLTEEQEQRLKYIGSVMDDAKRTLQSYLYGEDNI